MTVTDQAMASILANLAGKTAPANKPEPPPRSQWPTCRDPKCGEQLDPLWHDVGYHPICDAPSPAPAPTAQLELGAADDQAEPPSTVAELRGLLIGHDATSARSLQKTIGPSEIGVPCDRALGYRIHDTPRRRDTRVPWAPIQGTAVHAYVADLLTAHNTQLGRTRWLVEERVWPDEHISGCGDAYDTDTGTVIDWKLVGDNSLKKYRKAIRPEYRVQAHLYGLGHQRAGRDVRWVRIVCLHRSHDYDKSWEWTEPFNPDLAEQALERLYRVMSLLTDLGVDDNPPMWGAVPATPTPECNWCPYWRPDRPADNTGCPGDPAAHQQRINKFTDGLIAK